MSRPKIPLPAQPVLSILSADWDAFWPDLLKGRLAQRLGPVDFESEPMRFDFTDYYNAEFGAPITRRIVSFERLAGMDELADIKLFTNEVESELARPDGRRICNLDPGMLSLERLVLGTCKNLPHRIYLGKGVFADLSLFYFKKQWQSMFWTHPDYAGEEIRAVMTDIRRRYHLKIKQRFEKSEKAE